MTFEILPTFPTPIYSSQISHYDIVQTELEESYNNIDFSMNPNWGNTHYLSDPEFRENLIIEYNLENFYKEVHNHLNNYCESIEFPIREYFISSSWFALFKKGNYAHVHNHGDCDIAGVYYFKKSSDDGSFFFTSPVPALDSSCFRTGRVVLNPNEGEIIMFPGWLNHGVETNDTDEDRCSISFNILFDRDKK